MQYFGNILVKISPNNNKTEIFRIYMERAIEKCLRPNFLTPWKPRNSKNKSVYSFAGHPVTTKSVLFFKYRRPQKPLKNGSVP